jgi:hypothetical protein
VEKEVTYEEYDERHQEKRLRFLQAQKQTMDDILQRQLVIDLAFDVSRSQCTTRISSTGGIQKTHGDVPLSQPHFTQISQQSISPVSPRKSDPTILISNSLLLPEPLTELHEQISGSCVTQTPQQTALHFPQQVLPLHQFTQQIDLSFDSAPNLSLQPFIKIPQSINSLAAYHSLSGRTQFTSAPDILLFQQPDEDMSFLTTDVYWTGSELSQPLPVLEDRESQTMPSLRNNFSTL